MLLRCPGAKKAAVEPLAPERCHGNSGPSPGANLPVEDRAPLALSPGKEAKVSSIGTRLNREHYLANSTEPTMSESVAATHPAHTSQTSPAKPPTTRVLRDLSVLTGGQGGDGTLTVSDLLARYFHSQGMYVYNSRSVLSRIRGGYAALLRSAGQTAALRPCGRPPGPCPSAPTMPRRRSRSCRAETRRSPTDSSWAGAVSSPDTLSHQRRR